MQLGPAASHRQHQVLLVDDSNEVREAASCLLEVLGCDVVGAASGAEALAILERGLRPCVMLLDLHMPDMTGWELWERMRADAELQQTPVVIVSGDLPDPERARAAGIRDFLRKPGDVVRIGDAVERHCRLQPTPGPPSSSTPIRNAASGW